MVCTFFRFVCFKGGCALTMDATCQQKISNGSRKTGKPVFDSIHFPNPTTGHAIVSISRGLNGRKSCFDTKGQNEKRSGQKKPVTARKNNLCGPESGCLSRFANHNPPAMVGTKSHNLTSQILR